MVVDFLSYIVPFVVMLTVLVFVHELGHYLVARWNGVRVETFSIGFGPELFGWNDRAGTRWRVALLPLGGFVKFFGDMNAASAPDGSLEDKLTPEQRAVAFQYKRLGQRTAIVAAGPFANIIYAIVVLALVFIFYGQRVTPPEVGRVLPGSAAEAAGFQAGDVILRVDGDRITRFEEVEERVLLNPGRELDVLVARDGRELELHATPRPIEREGPDGVRQSFGDLGLYPANPAAVGAVQPGSPAEQAGFLKGDVIVGVGGKPIASFEELQVIVLNSGGRTLSLDVLRDGRAVTVPVTPGQHVRTLPDGETVTHYLIGIERAPRPLVRYGPLDAFWQAGGAAWSMVVRTLDYVGEMIVGTRGTENLGGPLRIAQVSGQAAQIGIEQLVMVSVLLSLNLGLINLFPIPVLDGGHLLFYAFEAVRGRPLTQRMQEFALRIGLAMILMLFVFTTWNDLVNLRIVERLAGLVS